MSGDLLEAVVAGARVSAEKRAERMPIRSLEREIAVRPPRGTAFKASLSAAGIRVIAECKRRSPSRGVLRQTYDPAGIARSYEHAGAAAISVLTEPTFFDGSLMHLRDVRAAVSIPLLRKDFIVLEYQVFEAAASGADAVLLIVAALDDDDLRRLLRLSSSLGLASVVEVHNAYEVDRALAADADIVGVNSRNLRRLDVNPAIFDELAARLPRGTTAVAESGLRTRADLVRLSALRYDAFLIGERFMTEVDPGSGLAALLAVGAIPS